MTVGRWQGSQTCDVPASPRCLNSRRATHYYCRPWRNRPSSRVPLGCAPSICNSKFLDTVSACSPCNCHRSAATTHPHRPYLYSPSLRGHMRIWARRTGGLEACRRRTSPWHRTGCTRLASSWIPWRLVCLRKFYSEPHQKLPPTNQFLNPAQFLGQFTCGIWR